MTQSLKGEAKKFLADVPAEKVFVCRDGSIFKNVQELITGLSNMTDETFAYHSNAEKKDFSNWVKDVIGDAKLADDLLKAPNRTEAYKCVASRTNAMKRRLI